MKRIFTFLAGVGLAFTLGCKTTNVETGQLLTSLAVYNGTFYVLSNNPDLKPEFQSALDQLDAVATTGTSAEGLLALLDQIPLGDDAEKLRPVIFTAKTLIRTYVDVPATPETDEALKVWAKLIADGLRQGIADAK